MFKKKTVISAFPYFTLSGLAATSPFGHSINKVLSDLVIDLNGNQLGDRTKNLITSVNLARECC